MYCTPHKSGGVPATPKTKNTSKEASIPSRHHGHRHGRRQHQGRRGRGHRVRGSKVRLVGRILNARTRTPNLRP